VENLNVFEPKSQYRETNRTMKFDTRSQLPWNTTWNTSDWELQNLEDRDSVSNLITATLNSRNLGFVSRDKPKPKHDHVQSYHDNRQTSGGDPKGEQDPEHSADNVETAALDMQ
jgi:hypothetical protein